MLVRIGKPAGRNLNFFSQGVFCGFLFLFVLPGAGVFWPTLRFELYFQRTQWSRWAKAEQHLIDWGLPSLRRAVAVQWDYEGPSHRQRWPLASVTFANQFWTYNRYLHISRVVPALFSVAGVSSLVELHSLSRMYGRSAVVQAASPPPPHPLH